MRRSRSNKPALLITPKTILFKRGNSFLKLDSIKDLTKVKLFELDVFIDGFPQEFTLGSLSSIRLFDRRSAVFQKLSRIFQSALLYGGRYTSRKKELSFDGFGFSSSGKLEKLIQELKHLKLPIRQVHSLVYSCAPPLLSLFLKQVRAKSVLWISSFVEEGLRIVFYHHQHVVFERIVPHSINHVEADQDLVQTLSYIQSEYDCSLSDLKILITTTEDPPAQSLKTLSKSISIYKWGPHELNKLGAYKLARANAFIEAWLIPWGQESKEPVQIMSKSALHSVVNKTLWIKRVSGLFQVLSLGLSLTVCISAVQIGLMQLRLHLINEGVSIKNERGQKLWTSLELPQGIDWAKFYQYAQKQKKINPDPLTIISEVAHAKTSPVLVQELLWRASPKSELKLSFHLGQIPEVNQATVVTQLKSHLLERLKQKGFSDLTSLQRMPQTIEISWP